MCRLHCEFTDPTSFVELTPSQARSVHLHLDLEVDFVNSVLTGFVDVTCKSQSVGECNLTLDSRDLLVSSVNLVTNTTLFPIEYIVDEKSHHPTVGTPIRVKLPFSETIGQEYKVRVEYSTTSACSALQWLTNEQTSSKKYPFMFSQCQAIHARSMVPCQDICLLKVTYSANIRYPSELTALMSAVRQGDPIVLSPTSSQVTYAQSVPIPPYLIAIACGELTSLPVGPRSRVWAEPSVVEKAAKEFEDTESIIRAGESLCGPYRFEVYDILVLPPSFPYGGMENPCLTFLTPTLLAGDKSQVDVLAHELAHSWSGNLVTNSTWQHFWLNEGLTVFTERKIVELFFGTETGNLRGQEGWDHLQQYVSEVGSEHNYTKLCPSTIWGEDPDDAFSVVPYEKGAALFWYLQSLVGKTQFESFIKGYFERFAFVTVDSEGFRTFFENHFEGHSALPSIDWSHWFHSPGMPSYKPPVDPTSIEEAQALAGLFIETPERSISSEESMKVSHWPSAKKCIFINALLSEEERFVHAPVVKKGCVDSMAHSYNFLATNCEVRCAFITLMLRVDGLNPRAQAEAVKLATEQGRMKYTRPMYKELAKVSKELAVATFLKHRPMYHPICAKMIARDLGIAERV